MNSFSYSYNQAIDIRGKAQGEVRSGTLLLTFANLPPDEIIDWMLNPRKYKDGSIVLCDMNDTPLQKISFENAACVGMDISYLESGNSYASTRITLRAKKMTVGNTVVENNWKNI